VRPTGIIALLTVALLPVGATARDKTARTDHLTTLTRISDSFEAVARMVSPAVVQIFATTLSASPGGELLRAQATGSGVVLDADGYIVTNAHVVGAARGIQVVLAPSASIVEDQRSILSRPGRTLTARIVGIDQETDLAVIKVDAVKLHYLELGDSDLIHAGQLVLAFGSPLGLENSVTMGVVSATARQLEPEAPMIYIQTDAPINPGSSGGPLVDTDGKVIGINTLIFSQSGGNEGIGFAAPANIIRSVFEQIRDSGRVRRGEIGVHAQTIDPILASALDLSVDRGVLIGDVFPGSAAAEAGLRVGDVVVSLNAKPMENGRQFDVNLYSRRAGDAVSLGIVRGDERRRVLVTVAERAADPIGLSELVSPTENVISELGVVALDLDETVQEMLPPLRHDAGVVIAFPAANTSLRFDSFLPGDVIYSINRTRITDLDSLRSFLEGRPAGTPLAVQVERASQLRFLSTEIR